MEQEIICRESFLVYRSFEKKRLPDPQRLRLYDAIFAYGIRQEEPDFSDDYVLEMLWEVIVPLLNKNRERWEYSKHGGAPVGSHNNPNGRRGKGHIQKPSGEQAEEKDQGQQDEAPKPKATKGSTKAFVPPTVEEVETYAAERGFLDPKGFARYYLDYQTEAKWTMSNGRKIKNWKLNVIQWEPNNINKAFSIPGSTTRRTLHERKPDYL